MLNMPDSLLLGIPEKELDHPVLLMELNVRLRRQSSSQTSPTLFGIVGVRQLAIWDGRAIGLVCLDFVE